MAADDLLYLVNTNGCSWHAHYVLIVRGRSQHFIYLEHLLKQCCLWADRSTLILLQDHQSEYLLHLWNNSCFCSHFFIVIAYFIGKCFLDR